MKANRNRPGRKSRARSERATDWRRWRRAPRLAVLAAATLAFLATPAQAATGGASTVAATEARAGEELAFTPMRAAGATWYGPGLYGNRTACGQTLRPTTVGVAHRSLPCGTAVKLAYRGRELVTRVIDRGPFSAGHDWDLTNGARKALAFEGSDRILYALELRYARQGAGSGRLRG